MSSFYKISKLITTFRHDSGDENLFKKLCEFDVFAAACFVVTFNVNSKKVDLIPGGLPTISTVGEIIHPVKSLKFHQEFTLIEKCIPLSGISPSANVR